MDSSLEQTRKPYVTIRPGKSWEILNLRDIWLYRDLLYTLTERDIKLRYRQTALGAIWIVLQPLLAAGVLSFVFAIVAKLKADNGLPYFVFSYAGTMGFRVFNDTLIKATGSLINNSSLVSKVFFPRVLLPISTGSSTFIDFLISLSLLFVFMLVFRIAPTVALFTMPLWFLLLFLMGLGFGLVGAALVVKFRDVANVVVVMAGLMQSISPAAYSSNNIPDKFKMIYFANPVSGLLEAFRWSLLGRSDVHWNAVIYSSVCAILLFLWGARLFRKMERGFADVI